MSLEHKRVDLTEKQKIWVRDFWSWVAVSYLGFKTPTVPDLIPRYTKDGRMIYVPAVECHIHHVNPVGTSTRVDHNPNYNVPQNLVPLSAMYHIGKGVRQGDNLADEVVHQDQMQFLWQYGAWASNGKRSPTPMDQLQENRRKLTSLGKPYHNQMWDAHFRTMIDRYLDEYMGEKKIAWPVKKNK